MSGHAGVAEFNEKRERVGKVHRPLRAPTARRNRSQYHVRCGNTIYHGLPVDVAPGCDVCLHCYPNARQS